MLQNISLKKSSCSEVSQPPTRIILEFTEFEIIFALTFLTWPLGIVGYSNMKLQKAAY